MEYKTFESRVKELSRTMEVTIGIAHIEEAYNRLGIANESDIRAVYGKAESYVLGHKHRTFRTTPNKLPFSKWK